MWFWVTNLLTWPNFFQVHPCCSLKPFFVLFFFSNNIPLYMNTQHFIYPFIHCWPLSCFSLWGCYSKNSMDIHARVFVQTCVLFLLGIHLKWNSESYSSVQFSSVTQSCPTSRPHGLQHPRLPCLLPTPTALRKLMCIELVMPSNRLILCHPLLLQIRCTSSHSHQP